MDLLLETVTKDAQRQEPLGKFNVGDVVDVSTRIKEGDKERVQIFNGTVIAITQGHGDINDSFVVRRVVDGVGVERRFPVHSPRVVGVAVVRPGQVRRAKLYYLRKRVGKATKVKERIISRSERESDQTAAATTQPG